MAMLMSVCSVISSSGEWKAVSVQRASRLQLQQQEDNNGT